MSTPEAGRDHAPPEGWTANGPSFPISLKSVASVMMLALSVWGYRAWPEVTAVATSRDSQIFLVLVAVVVVTGYVAIMISTTSIDGERIVQRWLWVKEVRLADIRQVKLIQVPGLHWLIVPRLVVRTSGLGVLSFPAGTPALLAAFRLLAHGRTHHTST